MCDVECAMLSEIPRRYRRLGSPVEPMTTQEQEQQAHRYCFKDRQPEAPVRSLRYRMDKMHR